MDGAVAKTVLQNDGVQIIHINTCVCHLIVDVHVKDQNPTLHIFLDRDSE